MYAAQSRVSPNISAIICTELMINLTILKTLPIAPTKRAAISRTVSNPSKKVVHHLVHLDQNHKKNFLVEVEEIGAIIVDIDDELKS